MPITNLLPSEREDISNFVQGRLAARGIELVESARKMLIGKAIGYYCEYCNLHTMREAIECEISLLPAIPAASDRLLSLGKCPKITQVSAYLAGIGVQAYQRRGEWFAQLPKAYDIVAIRKKIEKIR